MSSGVDLLKDCESTVICFRSAAGELEGGMVELPPIYYQNIYSSRLEMIFMFNNYLSSEHSLSYHLVIRITLVNLGPNLSRFVTASVTLV